MEQQGSSHVDAHTFVKAIHGFRYQVTDVARAVAFAPSVLRGISSVYRECRTRTILARAEPSTSTPAGVLSRSLIRRMRVREPR